MAAHPPDPEIENLLAELRSDDAARRKAALEKIVERKFKNDEITTAVKIRATTDPDATVRYWAEQALMAIGVAKVSLVPGRQTVSSSARSSPTRQFLAGFFLWLLINIPLMVVAGLANVSTSNSNLGALALLVNFLPLIANIVIITWLAFTPRRYQAFGALTALAAVLVLLLLVSPFTIAFCFSWPLLRG